MPNYTFRHKECQDNIVTLDMPMADREQWLANNPEFEQILTKMTLADPMMMGRLPSEAKDFQRNVLGRMAEAIPGNNIKQQMKRFNQSVEI